MASCIKRLFSKDSASEEGSDSRIAATLEKSVTAPSPAGMEDRLRDFGELRDELIQVYEDLFHVRPPHADVNGVELKASELNNRAVLYLELGQEAKARELWDAALKDDAAHLQATFNYGYLEWQKAQRPGSDLLDQLRRLERIHEGDPEYWTCLAWIYLEQGNIEEIERLRKEGRIQDPVLLRALQGSTPTGSLARAIEGHTNGVTSVCFLPNGRTALSGSWDRTIRLWDLATGRELRRLEGAGEVESISLSADGRTALSGGPEGICLWDVASGQKLKRFAEPASRVRSVCLSPDGRAALSGSYNLTLLWDVESGKELRRFEGQRPTYDVNSVCFSPDGRTALSGNGDGTLRLWDVATGREVRRLEGHAHEVHTVCFSPDGRHALSGSSNTNCVHGEIRLWDVEAGRELGRFEGHTPGVKSLCFSPDGRMALSGCLDRTLRLWDVATRRELRCFEGHQGGVTSICFSPDGRSALSGSWKTLRLWVFNFAPAEWRREHPFPLVSPARDLESMTLDTKAISSVLQESERALAAGRTREALTLLLTGQKIAGYQRDARLLELLAGMGRSGKAIRRGLREVWSTRSLGGHTDVVESVCFSPDSQTALSGSRDGTLRLWDVTTGQELRRFEGHRGAVVSLCFSPCGRTAVSASWDETFRLWDLVTGQELRCSEVAIPESIRRAEGTLRVRTTPYRIFVCLSPDGRTALSGSVARLLCLWDVETGQELKRFQGYPRNAISSCFSPDGLTVLSGHKDGTLRLWGAVSGRELQCLEGPVSDLRTRYPKRMEAMELAASFGVATSAVLSVCFSPDGRTAVTGSWDGTIHLWDVISGLKLRSLDGHTDGVVSVCFSPDGRFVLSDGADKTLRLWDVAAGQELRRLDGPHGTVKPLAFSPNGRFAISGTEDDTLHVWEFDWEWEVIGGNS